jgi:2-phospho-L-lactate guanylyltransferase (CobY/MobA/RfbA family)
MPVVEAVVKTVPDVVGSVSVVVPDTAGAERVTEPDVSPEITIFAIFLP